ncbi:MAG TPA: porin [Telluria sp.]
MKKSLFALLALSAVATAQAQSSVTVYGVVDVGFAKQTGKKLIQRENHASRLGFRGVEDLGNGLSAVFTLENEFLLDSGAQKGVLWERQANVGLTGAFGTALFGRTKNLVDSVQSKVEPFGADGVIGKVNEPMMRVGVSSSRVSNSVTYHSPKTAGFTGSMQYVLSEIDGASNGVSVLGQYDQGPVFAYVGFEKAAEKAAGTEQPSMWTAGGYYKFGALRLSGQYAQGDNEAAAGEFTGMLLGAVYTVGKGDFKAVISKQKQEAATFEKTTVREVGVGYDYHMSKRTDLYAYAGRERVSGVTSYQMGISHKF